MTNSYRSLFRCRGSNTIYVYGEITLFHCLGRVGGFRDFMGLGTLSTRYASAGNRRNLVNPGCYNGDCRTGRGGGRRHKKFSTEVKANSPSPSEHYYQADFDQSPSFIHRVLTPFGQVESDLWPELCSFHLWSGRILDSGAALGHRSCTNNRAIDGG